MAAYLEAALQEGDSALIAAALGDIARAKGMGRIARDAGLGRESLYKALSAGGNSEFATISEIVAGKRAITVDTGLRLSRYFGLHDGFWTGLQLDHDSALARDTLSEVLANIKPLQTE